MLNSGWETIPPVPQADSSPLFIKSNGIHVLEGRSDFISSQAGEFGIVLSDQRNDIARITQLYAESVEDFAGTLVIFTQFPDAASFSSAYFLPIYNPTQGTGMPSYDRRETFGTRRIEGFVNMQRLKSHAPNVLSVLTHEIAHRHSAYLEANVQSSTTPLSLLGREAAHWHAAFNSQGSFLEGYHWRETQPGRFVSIDKQSRLAPIDLYALGLLDADELSELFFIQEAKVASGARLPAAADLPVGTVVTGQRVDIKGIDIVAALGPRPRQTTNEIRFLYITRPGESPESDAVREDLTSLENIRLELEQNWREQTLGRGELITQPVVVGSRDSSIETDAATPIVAPTEKSNCDCSVNGSRSHSARTSGLLPFLLLAFLLARRGTEKTRFLLLSRKLPLPR